MLTTSYNIRDNVKTTISKRLQQKAEDATFIYSLQYSQGYMALKLVEVNKYYLF